MGESKGSVLIADDEPEIRSLITVLLRAEGFTTVSGRDGAEAVELAPTVHPDAAVIDLRMPQLDGIQVVRRLHTLCPDMPIIIVTAFGSIQGAIEAIRAGAYDYLEKPFDNDTLVRLVTKPCAEHMTRRKGHEQELSSGEPGKLLKMMGSGPVIRQLISEIYCVAWSNFSVLILGETGCGKELVARAIHLASRRPAGPFMPVDCGAIPENLLESELFGHEKGAFTGAVSPRQGLFDAAHGGTLFLDEVGNLPVAVQPKLLRALQEKEIHRVGGTKAHHIDVRVLTATNQKLEADVARGTFRPDLFFRINEYTCRVPSLHERPEDIPYLAQRFVEETCEELEKPLVVLTSEALAEIVAFRWPGNVRQLRATIRRAVLMADRHITPDLLDIHTSHPPADLPRFDVPDNPGSLKEAVKRLTARAEREILIDTLRRTGGNRALAARLLQIDYKTIQSKIRDLGISFDRERKK